MIHVNDKPLSVQQVVLGVYSHETKSETSFICPSKQNGQYACALDLKEASVQSSVDPGQTTLKLYIASHDVIPVSYNVGDIELSFTAPQKEESVWDIFHPLPEIKHQFRADEKMPNQLLSSVFSLGVLAPWLLLIGMYVSLSANVKNLFANSPSLTFGSVFIASLAAVMSLYYVYWLRLNLFQLLGYGSVIGVVTAVFGRQALVARAGLRGVTRTKKDF
ncbi:Dolichyl-diphosphooligosaccharide--protein glycosyltransferase subunit Swp1 [Powellomyces hirtus]|nr:Dolichyl-diphosphooligosaccharide--protein glycosyltransferase subunit Swp1 [Powellomyces hirtus]